MQHATKHSKLFQRPWSTRLCLAIFMWCRMPNRYPVAKTPEIAGRPRSGFYGVYVCGSLLRPSKQAGLLQARKNTLRPDGWPPALPRRAVGSILWESALAHNASAPSPPSSPIISSQPVPILRCPGECAEHHPLRPLFATQTTVPARRRKLPPRVL